MLNHINAHDPADSLERRPVLGFDPLEQQLESPLATASEPDLYSALDAVDSMLRAIQAFDRHDLVTWELSTSITVDYASACMALANRIMQELADRFGKVCELDNLYTVGGEVVA